MSGSGAYHTTQGVMEKNADTASHLQMLNRVSTLEIRMRCQLHLSSVSPLSASQLRSVNVGKYDLLKFEAYHLRDVVHSPSHQQPWNRTYQ